MTASHPNAMALDLERDADRPVTRVFRHVMLVARFFEQVVDETAASVGLQRGEFLVLMTLDRAGEDGMRPTELYRSLLVTAGAVTKRIDSLEQRSLVERVPCEADGRSARVRLTAEGRNLSSRIRAAANAMHAVGAAFGTDKLEALDELLRQYLSSITTSGHRIA